MKIKLLSLVFIVIIGVLIVGCSSVSTLSEFTTCIETSVSPCYSEEVTTIPLESIETEPAVFDSNITFTSEYITGNGIINHLLYTPSTDTDDVLLPLIVWLHGSGERYGGGNLLLQSGFPNVLNNWELDGFNAYVLCPHLTGKFGYSQWNSPGAAKSLTSLLDKFISEHNVDTDNIIIVGHSLGGQGALYMAHELPEYFSKCVVLSGYHPGIDISKIDIKTLGYVGTARAGEDLSSINYMKNSFVPVFGDDSFYILQASHGGVPKAAFIEDKDGNGRSDLIEWMLQNIS